MLIIEMIKAVRRCILLVLVSHDDEVFRKILFFIVRLCFFFPKGIVDSPECVELLLQHSAKVNAQDLKNNTAAMVACFFNKPRILATLIRAGADLTVRNNEGQLNLFFWGFFFFLTFLFFFLSLGKDAYDVAVEKEFDECKETVTKALEKRGIKVGQKPASAEKVSEDLEKLKLKR